LQHRTVGNVNWKLLKSSRFRWRVYVEDGSNCSERGTGWSRRGEGGAVNSSGWSSLSCQD